MEEEEVEEEEKQNTDEERAKHYLSSGGDSLPSFRDGYLSSLPRYLSSLGGSSALDGVLSS